jgi:hypothetical protein
LNRSFQSGVLTRLIPGGFAEAKPIRTDTDSKPMQQRLAIDSFYDARQSLHEGKLPKQAT